MSDEQSKLISPNEDLNQRKLRWAETFEPSLYDGIFLYVAKLLLGCRLLRFFYWKFIEFYLYMVRSGKTRVTPHEAKARNHFAGDFYIVFCTLLLLVSYTAVYAGPTWLAIIGLIFASFRSAEILSVFIEVNAKARYETQNPIRAVLNTLWHFVEFGIIFATVFMAISTFGGDTFSREGGQSIRECWFDPIYFSFVTLSTLGYGDLSPNSLLGKIAVVCEVLTGIILLVFVFARALNATESVGTSKNSRIHEDANP